MSKRNRFVAGVLAIMLALVVGAIAQGPPEQPDIKIDSAAKNTVIESTLKKLNDLYVFPETAKKMEDAIRERQKAGEYEKIDSAREFARKLTTHLQDISHDKHLRVFYNYKPQPEPKGDDGPTPQALEQFRAQMRVQNYGFKKVERLPGNIGYLKFDFFAPASDAGETLAGAMNFLANTQALIIDLRENGGGNPGMVQLVCSYLFSPDPVHLNDLYFRPANETRQFWTLENLPGKRFVGKDVYVLTSHRTFSGAEECTYNLKTQKRATIIGETTGGGANPGGTRWVHPNFAVFVPTGRAINPITHTNWEGTGIKPDVEVPADQAFKVAELDALKKQLPGLKDPEDREAFERLIADREKELDAIKARK